MRIFEELLQRDSNAGTVTAVSESTLTVATPRGPVTARRSGATVYHVGDRVRLSAGQVVGRLRASSTVVRV